LAFIWITSATFHKNQSFCIKDFYFFVEVLSQVCVSSRTYWRTSPVTNKMLLKEEIKMFRVGKGYGAKRLVAEFSKKTFFLLL